MNDASSNRPKEMAEETVPVDKTGASVATMPKEMADEGVQRLNRRQKDDRDRVSPHRPYPAAHARQLSFLDRSFGAACSTRTTQHNTAHH